MYVSYREEWENGESGLWTHFRLILISFIQIGDGIARKGKARMLLRQDIGPCVVRKERRVLSIDNTNSLFPKLQQLQIRESRSLARPC
jgi:hypothetical protein